MRDGTPLPGRTSAQVLSQLAHRVFGPLHPTRIRIVLDYHGLIDQPAGALIDIAHRHRVTTRTVSNNAATVRAAGLRLPLPATLIVEASRASAPFDDHLGRARIAATLGLPTPDPAPVNKRTPLMGEVQAGHLTAARAAMRVIAAIGPLDLPTLAAGIARSRRFRTRNPLSDSDLADALTTAGCTPDPAGRWHPPAGVVAPDRYQRIVTLAAGRDLTRAEMIDILITAGYRESSRFRAAEFVAPAVSVHRTGPVPAGRLRLTGQSQSVGLVSNRSSRDGFQLERAASSPAGSRRPKRS